MPIRKCSWRTIRCLARSRSTIAFRCSSGSPSPGNSPGCRLTEIVVLDGQALLNDGALIVPIGHAADTETCFGADGQVESQSGWDNLRALEPDELQERFGLLAQMPPRLLRYPIRIPTGDDMQRAQATPTPRPAAPAPPPDEPRPPTTLGVDCSAFRSTSPSDGLAFGPQQFFWDAAPGAERYRVVVRATDRPGQVRGEVNAPATNLTLDLGLGSAECPARISAASRAGSRDAIIPQAGRGIVRGSPSRSYFSRIGCLKASCSSGVMSAGSPAPAGRA
jgi:hypothetical protein